MGVSGKKQAKMFNDSKNVVSPLRHFQLVGLNQCLIGWSTDLLILVCSIHFDVGKLFCILHGVRDFLKQWDRRMVLLARVSCSASHDFHSFAEFPSFGATWLDLDRQKYVLTTIKGSQKTLQDLGWSHQLVADLCWVPQPPHLYINSHDSELLSSTATTGAHARFGTVAGTSGDTRNLGPVQVTDMHWSLYDCIFVTIIYINHIRYQHILKI